MDGRANDPEQPLSLLLDDQLCFALYATSRALTAAYRPSLDRMGITYPQYLVLMVLWEYGAVPMKDLAAHLQLDYGTLSPLVKRLAAAGLVQRERSASDERTVMITPTEQALALQADASCMVSDVMERAGITLEDARELRARITELAAALAANPPAREAG